MANSAVSLVRVADGEYRYLLAKPLVSPGTNNNRKPLICIHGMSGFADYFAKKMEYFAREGYACFAPDIIGHGARSEIDISKKGVHDYIADVNKFINHVVCKESGESLILVGHSMGGLIAAKLAEIRNDVGHVVLVTPAPPKGVFLLPGGLISLTLGDLNGLIVAAFGGERFSPSRRLLESLFVDPVASKQVIDEWEGGRISNESLLATLQLGFSRISVDARMITAPMLVIGAKKDKIIHHRSARSTAEYYAADYHTLERLGHMCPFESGWEETAEVILMWLKKNGALP